MTGKQAANQRGPREGDRRLVLQGHQVEGLVALLVVLLVALLVVPLATQVVSVL